MKKYYIIMVREIVDMNSYYPSETIKKHRQLGFKNNFFTYEEAVNFLIDSDNNRFFNQNQEYFIQEMFSL